MSRVILDYDTYDALIAKFEQAIRIKSRLLVNLYIDFFQKRSEKTPQEIRAMLESNIETEEYLIPILKRGCVGARTLLQQIRGLPGIDHLQAKGKHILTVMEAVFGMYENELVPAMTERLASQAKYAQHKTFPERFLRMRSLLSAWREELLVVQKIRNYLDQKEIIEEIDFWDKVHYVFLSLPKESLSTLKKIWRLPKAERGFQALYLGILNTLYSYLVPLPFNGLYWLLSSDADFVERVAVSNVIFWIGGFVARIGHAMMYVHSSKEMEELEQMLIEVSLAIDGK